jgi:hypothetical protein
VAGWKDDFSQMHDKIMKKFRERLATVASLAAALNRVVGEDMTSAEFQVMAIGHGVHFDNQWMEDALTDVQGVPANVAGPVLCTTDLGLLRTEKVSGEGPPRLNATVLLKAKVALESYFDEAR